MKHVEYQTQGTCSTFITVDLDEENRIKNVEFTGGCNGNLQGICSLIKGMKAEDVKARLDGIRCGYKRTSCPDQLCRAIDEALQM